MRSKNRIKYLFIGCVLVLALFALADSLGFFNEKPWTEVSHGSHIHYVPHDRDPDVPIHNFPQQEPGPGEEITPTGQTVRTGEPAGRLIKSASGAGGRAYSRPGAGHPSNSSRRKRPV